MTAMTGSDKLQNNIDRPYATPEVHAKAYAVLKRFGREGKLPQIPEWNGDLVEGYVEILGVKR
jgi:hypothetical protein